jgi:hypothetical protein
LVIVATSHNDVVALNADDGSVNWVTSLGDPLSVDEWNSGLDQKNGKDENVNPWHGVTTQPRINKGTTCHKKGFRYPCTWLGFLTIDDKVPSRTFTNSCSLA